MAMDRNGNIFFGVSTKLVCWSPNNSNYSPSTIRGLIDNRDTLQFISGIKVIRNVQGVEELWIVSNRLQKFFTGTMDYTETNYRIQAARVDQLTNGRGCFGNMVK